VSKPEADSQVTAVEVEAHFVTAIRMPEVVNSVAVGDPTLFQVEHSPNEPNLVFVKPLTDQPAETDLLISTGNGQETSLLIVSKGTAGKRVDFVVNYERPGSFLIEPDYPSPLIGETVPAVPTGTDMARAGTGLMINNPTSLSTGFRGVAGRSLKPNRPSSLDKLLARQERAPLPLLYGEHPGTETAGGEHVRAGVSEVIDGGQQVIVLFSAINPTKHAILLMPPQVQLGGRSKAGVLHGPHWTTAEQLPVEDFRLSPQRLAPGERADGVVLFERPPYKQSNETLFLQVADAGAVDHPALVPIGFGVSKVREEAQDARQK
jgi:hypothetical protein